MYPGCFVDGRVLEFTNVRSKRYRGEKTGLDPLLVSRARRLINRTLSVPGQPEEYLLPADRSHRKPRIIIWRRAYMLWSAFAFCRRSRGSEAKIVLASDPRSAVVRPIRSFGERF